MHLKEPRRHKSKSFENCVRSVLRPQRGQQKHVPNISQTKSQRNERINAVRTTYVYATTHIHTPKLTLHRSVLTEIGRMNGLWTE